MQVAMFSTKPYDQKSFESFSHHHQLRYIEARLNRQTAELAKDCQAVCCFVNDDLSADVLTSLSELGVQFIVLRSAGYNHVDLEAAQALGLKVCRVPEYSPYAVAEHTVGLILALNRKLHRAHNRVRENDYSLNGLMGFDLHGKTVGVIGAGKIGQAFLHIMAGFGCRLLVFDTAPSDEVQSMAELVSLETIWKDSDVISLHCPLTPQTYHLVDEKAISLMKPGVMLINTSRGALVDARAVIAALKSGGIGYLGLDVYEEEGDLFFEDYSDKVIQDDVFARLTTFPNVLITGHQAFFTHEAMQKIANVTLQNLDGLESGDLQSVQLISARP